jgi:hypothetical protein
MPLDGNDHIATAEQLEVYVKAVSAGAMGRLGAKAGPMQALGAELIVEGIMSKFMVSGNAVLASALGAPRRGEMKLIQAVKIITEAGLTPEMYYRARKDDVCGEEQLALFGVRRWPACKGSMGSILVEERDIVVCVIIQGGSVDPYSADRFKDDLANGLAKSHAREAAAKAERDDMAA